MKICIYFQTLTSLLLLGSLFGWLGVAVLSSLAFFECFPVHKFILLRLLKLNTKICRQSDKPGKKCKDKFNIHILQHSVFSNIPFDNWRRICWASFRSWQRLKNKFLLASHWWGLGTYWQWWRDVVPPLSWRVK